MLDRLTLDQLRILVAVAETGSFSAAARRLGRVQSAISQSVQSLEDVLQVQLFSRGGKTPTLTEAGAALLEDARYLIRGAETLRARAQSMAEDVEPELTLAIDSMFPSTILMESLRGLSREFPNLPVTVFTEGLGGPRAAAARWCRTARNLRPAHGVRKLRDRISHVVAGRCGRCGRSPARARARAADARSA